MLKNYVAFDLETTGLNVETDEIIEIGALKVKNGKVADRFNCFLKPTSPISPMITNITGITNEMVACAKDTKATIEAFVAFCEDNVLIGHNILFDYKFMKKYASMYSLPFEKEGVDTLKIARVVKKDLPSKSLEALCEHYNIVNAAAHRAYHDALATAKLYQMMAHSFEEQFPKPFVPEQLQYKPKKVQPATEKQKNFLESLILCHHLEIVPDYNHLTRSEASKMIDRIILEHGNLNYR